MADQELRATATGHVHTQPDLQARVTAARRGINVEEAVKTMESWSVPVARFAAILGCSERTWVRVRAGSPDVLLPRTESDRFLRTLRIFKHALTVFDDDTAAHAWMSARNAALGGGSPLSLLDTDEGVRLVDEVLTRLEYGVYA